jgi:hypothetical protein
VEDTNADSTAATNYCAAVQCGGKVTACSPPIRSYVSVVTLLIKDSTTRLYLCADGTWCEEPDRALKFDTARAGVAYLRSRDLRATMPQLVWKGERAGFDWVIWPRTAAA